MLWNALKPGNLLLVLLCLGVVLMFSRRQGAGKTVLTMVVVVLLIIAIIPLGAWILLPLEKRFPPPKRIPDSVYGIIVLGGAFERELILAHRQLVLKDSGERIMAFFHLARRYPKAGLIFAGGKGSLGPEGLDDALPAKAFFGAMGIHYERVILEEKARNTYENALFCKKLVGSIEPGHWILITSAWHMPRAVGVFRKAGWEVIPYPVDFKTTGKFEMHLGFDVARGLQLLALGLKEWIALIQYRLLGRSDQWVPGP
jgi:uncharacterized SAM-binding protein YcdF (DUF218 family)